MRKDKSECIMKIIQYGAQMGYMQSDIVIGPLHQNLNEIFNQENEFSILKH
jgi:hypothetical protein